MEVLDFINYFQFIFACTELNNKTAHRTHNNTVFWFIPLQSTHKTLTKLDEKTSKENSRSLFSFFVS